MMRGENFFSKKFSPRPLQKLDKENGNGSPHKLRCKFSFYIHTKLIYPRKAMIIFSISNQNKNAAWRSSTIPATRNTRM